MNDNLIFEQNQESKQESAEINKELKYISYAWITTAVSALLTVIVAFLSTYSENIKYRYGIDLWSLIDAAIVAGLAYGIYRKNRYCALTMFIYFFVSKLGMFFAVGSGGAVSIIFLVILCRGTIATFRVYNYRVKIGEIQPKTRRGIKRYLAIGGLTVLGFGFMFLIFIGVYSPSTEVVPGQFLKNEYMEFMRQEGLISLREKVDYWYSDAFYDFRKGFYFITDEKVVLYSSEWAEPAILIPYSEIADIQYYYSDSVYEDSAIVLFLNDSSVLGFPVSSENSGDKRFVERMLQHWRKKADGQTSHSTEA